MGNNTVKLLDVAALTVDLPEYNLWRGQVGTVVESLADGAAFEVHKAASVNPLHQGCCAAGATTNNNAKLNYVTLEINSLLVVIASCQQLLVVLLNN